LNEDPEGKVCPTDTQDHILLTASPTQHIAQHVLNEDPEGKISQQTHMSLAASPTTHWTACFG
jgi:hypothetical protein